MLRAICPVWARGRERRTAKDSGEARRPAARGEVAARSTALYFISVGTPSAWLTRPPRA